MKRTAHPREIAHPIGIGRPASRVVVASATRRAFATARDGEPRVRPGRAGKRPE